MFEVLIVILLFFVIILFFLDNLHGGTTTRENLAPCGVDGIEKKQDTASTKGRSDDHRAQTIDEMGVYHGDYSQKTIADDATKTDGKWPAVGGRNRGKCNGNCAQATKPGQ